MQLDFIFTQPQRVEELPPLPEVPEMASEMAFDAEMRVAPSPANRLVPLSTSIFAPERFWVPAAPLSDHFGVLTNFRVRNARSATLP